MLWFILSLASAIFKSTEDLFNKKSLEKIDEFLATWGFRGFALFFSLPLLFLIPIPSIDSQFWYALIISGGLNVLIFILYMKAIKSSPLSLTVPMLAFTPLFLLLTSPLILGEFPNTYGLIGILLIVSGAYLLNIKERDKGLLAPFKSLIRERGPVLMLAVAFFWSITVNIDKIGIKHSSPIFWVIAWNMFLFVGLSIIVLIKRRREIRSQFFQNIKTLLPAGLFSILNQLSMWTAVTMTLVPYVISIKRTSTIFSSLYGFFVFKEPFLKTRLLGVIIMVLGVLFITLF
jgi:drug/metabolite transporter (DMT)-like permease